MHSRLSHGDAASRSLRENVLDLPRRVERDLVHFGRVGTLGRKINQSGTRKGTYTVIIFTKLEKDQKLSWLRTLFQVFGWGLVLLAYVSLVASFLLTGFIVWCIFIAPW